ncbi:phosphonate metabolism transcriptional regulator PhnF [Rhizobium miluonense]|uniref:GntR family transcriptional regulator, phosphonate transport system regulatory protein n=1 Tax=Rhizobium miluonense TaxID=411945 RepID=A0A1C3WDP9_9HYPH|nr:phosphonate metabolism transcriptional regulator PhnF [Rhizobium miluonense]SCB38071.1 GntR family transcriptional regulator, phosphonate transport system regulatory protein [Rhizobium miluonense]
MMIASHQNAHSLRGNRFIWQMIKDELLKEVQTGELKPGEKIPTEKELAARFQVNVNTVRHALAKMQAAGVLRGERGSGIYVKEDTLRYPIGRTQQQSVELQRLQRPNLRQFLGAKTVRAQTELASALQIPSDSFVRKIETLTWVETRPFSFATYYYPLPRFHGIDLKIREYGSITRSLKDFGISDYRRLQSVIRPKALGAREAKLLNQKKSKPSLMVKHINVDLNGAPIQVGICIEAAWVELLVQFEDEIMESVKTPA